MVLTFNDALTMTMQYISNNIHHSIDYATVIQTLQRKNNLLDTCLELSESPIEYKLNPNYFRLGTIPKERHIIKRKEKFMDLSSNLCPNSMTDNSGSCTRMSSILYNLNSLSSKSKPELSKRQQKRLLKEGYKQYR
jgi:hypothetical protein